MHKFLLSLLIASVFILMPRYQKASNMVDASCCCCGGGCGCCHCCPCCSCAPCCNPPLLIKLPRTCPCCCCCKPCCCCCGCGGNGRKKREISAPKILFPRINFESSPTPLQQQNECDINKSKETNLNNKCKCNSTRIKELKRTRRNVAVFSPTALNSSCCFCQTRTGSENPLTDINPRFSLNDQQHRTFSTTQNLFNNNDQQHRTTTQNDRTCRC